MAYCRMLGFGEGPFAGTLRLDTSTHSTQSATPLAFINPRTCQDARP